MSDDPTGEARILFRLPDQWNGKLVVAGASGTRSEFNGDFAWGDYVLQQGYAYVSQNKGVLNFHLTTADDPLGCRLNPSSTTFVHFYDNDPGQPFTRWTDFMIEATRIGKNAVTANYGRYPGRTYAVGTSNGGYQVRRALETAPELFDGGVDWEGTYIDPVGPNILSGLPPAILNFPDYAASGLDPNSTAAKNIVLTGYPPDLVDAGNSLWARYSDQYWELTLCQWQKRLDPTYDTYTSGTGTYSYVARLSASDVGANVAQQDGDGKDRRPAYRLYEVQNGNHIETYTDTTPAFPELELIQPHAQRAFDLLTDYVERGSNLPPDQCIPRGGSITATPTEPGHCEQLFVP
jgi:hypothetical protein